MRETSGDKSHADTVPKAAIDELIALIHKARMPEALAHISNLCKNYPGDALAFKLSGVVKSRMDLLDQALVDYERALSLRPGYAEAHSNKGNVLFRLGRYDEAISSFQEALKRIPNFAEAHNSLGNAYQAIDQLEEAIASYREALRIKPEYTEAHNNLGTALKDLNRPRQALESLARAIHINPNFAPAYYNAGNALRTLGRYDEAMSNFGVAIQLNRVYAEAYNALGNTFNDQGRHREAVEQIRHAIELKPHLAAAHNDLGNALSDLGRHDEAMSSYLTALRLNPDFAEVHSNLGNALCEFGRYDEAVQSYGEALRIKPEFAEAHNNLSRIKKYTREDPQLSDMLKRLATPGIGEHELMHLSFALGKAYDDIGEIDKAFAFLADGNRLRKKAMAYDIRSDKAQFELIKSLFSSESAHGIDTGSTIPADVKVPIFIVGVPRSGTTLTEQILASHSQVFGAGELQALGRIVRPVTADLGRRGKSRADPDVLTSIRNDYLKEISQIAAVEPYITDKMPENFKWIGFLLEAMPGVRIINLQRDPVASCWSMFKIQFSGNGYTNSLEDLAEYYHLYQDLMNFWRTRFPNQIYDLNYQALTENQEIETRKLLEYCGLEWEDQCLEFHRTKRTVRTPSSQQVRKKMYTGSSESWRRYESHLEPLLRALGRSA
jgi:tetratricopeptide (TPR) repeat protein